MDLFYFARVKGLLSEVFQARKKKTMNGAGRFFTFLVTLPFFLLFLFVAALLLVAVTIFEIIESPAKYLQGVVHKEGQQVKHATQAVLYFIAWPFIILDYVFIKLFALIVNILYVAASITGWICSLGSFKFHLSVLEEDYVIEEPKEIKKGRTVVLCIFGLLFLILGLVVMFVGPMLLQSIGAIVKPLSSKPVSLAVMLGYLYGQLAGKTLTLAQATTVANSLILPMVVLIGMAILAIYAIFVVLMVTLGYNNKEDKKEQSKKASK